jgi:acetyl-CoA synthetase
MMENQKTAFFWEGEGKEEKLAFGEVEQLASQFAHLLIQEGVNRGDRVFFFLPRIPELYFGFLGAQKTGAITGAFFAALGPQALFDRLHNAGAKVLVTNKQHYERVRSIRFKLPALKKIILIEDGFRQQLQRYPSDFKQIKLAPEEPNLMLYTSATGNTPVCGIVLPQKALKWQIESAKLVLDLKEHDVYWCTADPGWVTGTVYGLLVPWHLGITQVIYAGRFAADKWYYLMEKYQVSVLYTAPTALRLLQQEDSAKIKPNLSSLRQVCSVGEALTPASWTWFKRKFNLEIHDTWWQTETGSMMIANYSQMKIKPGSMGKSLPWVKAAIIDEKGKELPTHQTGFLGLKPPIESGLIDIWQKSENLKRYFKNAWYYSGDLAYRDEEDYFWFVGRADEVIKTSGERVGAFEVERVLADHPAVLETAVIGKPDEMRGEVIKAFVVLQKNYQPSEALTRELQVFTKEKLAGHAYPREIEYVKSLPKNRAGKIVRRLLKAKELGLPIGNTSTVQHGF